MSKTIEQSFDPETGALTLKIPAGFIRGLAQKVVDPVYTAGRAAPFGAPVLAGYAGKISTVTVYPSAHRHQDTVDVCVSAELYEEILAWWMERRGR